MAKIKLNKETTIDLPTLIDSRLLVQANSGGGKSWALRRILEQSHGKVQQIILDSEGEFGTLREKYDYILAGKEGDTPATPQSAALLARKLLEMNVSAIIDLYELHPQERKRFVKLFLDAMVNAPKDLWHPCMVVLDEAHQFAPEKGQSEAMDAVIGLATLGRKRGFCAVLATQRLSKLHKDAAAECNNKLIGRTGLDIDMKRASEELGFTSKEQYLSLRQLEPGEFFAYGPALSREVVKMRVGSVQTTHPKAGARIITKTTPPTSKIKAALKKLGDLPQEARKEAQTIEEMRAEIRTLRAHRCPKEASPEVIERAVTQSVAQSEQRFIVRDKERNKYIEKLEGDLKEIGRVAAIYMGDSLRKEDLVHAKEFLSQQSSVIPVNNYVSDRKIRFLPEKPAPQVERVSKEFDSWGEKKPLGAGERKVLTAVAQYPEGASREQLTILTGYKRSSRDAYIQRLRSSGLVEIQDNAIVATSEGIGELGSSFEPLPTGEALIEYWNEKLPEGERKIFSILVENYPGPVDREALSDVTGYQRSSRDAYIQRLRSRRLVRIEGPGRVKAADLLFIN